MSYRTIAVHVEPSVHMRNRVEAAIRLAMEEDAHLVGVAVTGIPADRPALEVRPQHETEALDEFERLVRQAGVGSFEKRLVEDDMANGISVQGLYTDLIVLGRRGADASAAGEVDFLQYVVLNSGCPVLIVPESAQFRHPGERVLLAWNASKAAAHAVRSALPVLKRASLVEIAMINADARPEVHGEEPGADIGAYLARHGVPVAVIRQTMDTGPGRALLSLAAHQSSDMLVMGCVAHPRYPGVLLGGATRTVLESATIPVLMAH